MGRFKHDIQINKPIIGYDNYECQNVRYVPAGGKEGQVLTKLKRSYDWVDAKVSSDWESIEDKPFQTIDKNYLEVNDSNELTLRDNLIKDLQETKASIIVLKDNSSKIENKIKAIETSLEWKNY